MNPSTDKTLQHEAVKLAESWQDRAAKLLYA